MEMKGVDPYGEIKSLSNVPAPPAREETKAIERIICWELQGNPMTMFYAMRRTPQWIEVAEVFQGILERDPEVNYKHSLSLSCITLWELAAAQMTLARGQLQSIPQVMSCRHLHDTNTGSKLVAEAGIIDVMMQPHWSGMINYLEECISKLIVEETGIILEQAHKLINASLWKRLSDRISVVEERNLKKLFPELEAFYTVRWYTRLYALVKQRFLASSKPPSPPNTPEVSMIRQAIIPITKSEEKIQ